MQEKARILVDVDGVIANFVNGFMYLYTEKGGIVPEGFEWIHWDSMDDLPDQDIRNDVWDDLDLFRILKPYSGSIIALQQMNKHYDVRIVTALPHKHIPIRSAWFKHYAPFIHRKDQMVFTSDKSIVTGDILIDDNVDHVRSWLGAGNSNAILIDRPWNQLDRWQEIGTRMSGLWEFNERIGIAYLEEDDAG
jgi:5'(3')-deoxyribonucleotidase